MKLLKFLYIIQEVDNKNYNPRLGKGFSTAFRFNPYNPLSYLTLIIMLIIGIILFGFVGIWKESNIKNPFKWN